MSKPLAESKMKARHWTINQLALELNMNHRTVASRLRDVEPIKRDGRSEYYLLRDAVPAILGNLDKRSEAQAQRARLDRARADKTELEVAEAQGRLVDVEQVAQQWERMVLNAKQRLLAMPTKAAPLVLGCKTLAQAKETIEGLVHEALRELGSEDTAVRVARGEGVEPSPKADRQRVGRRAPKTEPRKQRRAR